MERDMPDVGEDDPEYADRIASYADTHKDAWQHTLDDMQAMADDLDGEGWNVLAIAVDHTAPNPPDAGDSDRWGFVHVIPGNDAEAFSEAVEAGEFPRYRVFQQSASGRVFMVTQLLDPDTDRAILIAGTYEIRNAAGLVRTARREGEMYTHVQTLDKTPLGVFHHDEYEQFFPNPERYERYTPSETEGSDEE